MKNSIKHILLYIENRKQRYQHDLETEVSYSVITETRARLSELNHLQRVVEDELNRLCNYFGQCVQTDKSSS